MAIGLVLLVVTAAVVALLLKHSRAAGWAVLGGAVAGVLLGPTLLGRTMPQQYERMYVGGVEQRKALDDLVAEQNRERIAAEAAGMDRPAMAGMAGRQRAAREPLEQALREARWEHQQPLRLFTGGVVALVLLGGGLLRRARPDPRQSMFSSVNIGVWAAALPGALAYAAALRWWGSGTAEAALAASSVMIGPWVLTAFDRRAAEQAEAGGAWMIHRAGGVASAISILVFVIGLWVARGSDAVLHALPLGGLVVGWGTPVLRRRAALRVRAVLHHGFIPVLAAVVAVKCDLISDAALWPIVILVVLSGDGRWLGAVIGASLLGGRRGLRTMQLVLGTMACGPTQIALVAIGLHAWGLPESLALALLLGAVLIEATAGLRRSMALWLRKLEVDELAE